MPEPRPPTVGKRLRRRIGIVLILVSFLPIALLGVGAWFVFSRLLLRQALQVHRTAVSAHASAIDLYLAERLRALELTARTHTVAQLSDPEQLHVLFEHFEQAYPQAFVDLGVIDADGRHLAYAGPYDLADKNYANTDWFRSVMSSGTYVSDVFLGYRKVPHTIIAVRRREGARTFVLRATINNDSLYSLVRAGVPDREGDAFVVNREGTLQTPPRVGRVLDKSGLDLPEPHQGVVESRARAGDTPVIRATAWVNDGRWMLVVQQPESSITQPIDEAAATLATVLALVLGLGVMATWLATRHLADRVDAANAQRDRLREELMRSARLASLGEIATGLAHEINNPLAVISAEQTNLRDLLDEAGLGSEASAAIESSLGRCRRQVERCAGITGRMLQFGRESKTAVAPVNLDATLREITELLANQARARNVQIHLQLPPGLPAVLVDRSEFEQVIVNLIHNALHAIERDGAITLRACEVGGRVTLEIEDTGSGIAPEHLERVFQPFFTTKPPGSGTGLGLSVCHGLVTGWGGSIEVESQPGQGATFRMVLKSDAGARRDAAPSAARAGGGGRGLNGGRDEER